MPACVGDHAGDALEHTGHVSADGHEWAISHARGKAGFAGHQQQILMLQQRGHRPHGKPLAGRRHSRAAAGRRGPMQATNRPAPASALRAATGHAGNAARRVRRCRPRPARRRRTAGHAAVAR
ncbi:hypothetical protein G6F63_015333 [Rhizopus arrhizus]|nr:hypothetical protein G6F63_015333 [Rhizopus arrhizus]